MKQFGLKIIFAKSTVVGVICSAVIAAQPCLAAEFKLTPALSLSEEFNDNIMASATDERTDLVTRVQPGLKLLFSTSRISTDLAYKYIYSNYARGSRGDEQSHNLALTGSIEVAKIFFMEISDTLSRVSLDVARDVTSESQFANQTDQNRASLSPYLLWHSSVRSLFKTGYRYTDTRYWKVAANRSGIDKMEHTAFANLKYDPMARLSLSGSYTYSNVDTELVSYQQHGVETGVRYEYIEHSSLFGGIGNNWQEFSDSRSASNLFWNVGLSHDFGSLVATMEARVKYIEDPLTVSTRDTTHSVRLEKALEHGSVGLSIARSEYDAVFTSLHSLYSNQGRRTTAIAGFGRFDVSSRLSTSLSLSGDKVSGPTANGLPYHLTGTVGANYAFNTDINAAFAYTHVHYRRDLERPAEAVQTNRLLLEIKKVFMP